MEKMADIDPDALTAGNITPPLTHSKSSDKQCMTVEKINNASLKTYIMSWK